MKKRLSLIITILMVFSLTSFPPTANAVEPLAIQGYTVYQPGLNDSGLTLVGITAGTETQTGVLGLGYWKGFTGNATESNYIEFKINSKVSETRKIKIQSIRVNGQIGWGNLYLNGAAVGPWSYHEEGPGWVNSEMTLSLNAGENTVKLTSFMGNLFVNYFAVETPAITASVASGKYSDAQAVEFFGNVTGSTIYYTTDNGDPTDAQLSRKEYTGTISVDQTTTFKVVEYADGAYGKVASFTYEIVKIEPGFVLYQPGKNDQSVTTGGTTKATAGTIHNSLGSGYWGNFDGSGTGFEGNYIEIKVKATEAMTKTVRVCATRLSTSWGKLYANGVFVQDISDPSDTALAPTWKTYEISVSLIKGENVIRINGFAGSFLINYVAIEKGGLTGQITQYAGNCMPVDKEITAQVLVSVASGNETIKLVKQNGTVVDANISLTGGMISVLPKENLSYSTSYTIDMSGCKDIDGEKFDNITFVTAPASLTVSGVTACDSKAVIIKGISPYVGSNLDITVYKQGAVVVNKTVFVDPSGGYTFDFTLSDEDVSDYVNKPFEITAVLGGYTAQNSFRYLTTAALPELINEISEASADEIRAILEQNYGILSLTYKEDTYFPYVTGEANVTMNRIIANSYFLNAAELKKVAKQAVILAAASSGNLIRDDLITAFNLANDTKRQYKLSILYSDFGFDILSETDRAVAENLFFANNTKIINETTFNDELFKATTLAAANTKAGEMQKAKYLAAVLNNTGQLGTQSTYGEWQTNGKRQTKVIEILSGTANNYITIEAFIEDLKSAIERAKSISEGGYTPKPGNSGGGSSSITGSFLAPAVATEPLKPIGSSFKDVSESHWAFEGISKMVEKGVVKGYAEGTFRPDQIVTREEFVKMLVTYFNITATNDKAMTFSDVNSSDWYCNYVLAAYSAGIVTGTTKTAFGAGAQISRQDMAVLVQRALIFKNHKLDKKGDTKFSDENEIAPYAKDAVYQMSDNGILSGVGDAKFAPAGLATRAMTVQILYNCEKSGI